MGVRAADSGRSAGGVSNDPSSVRQSPIDLLAEVFWPSRVGRTKPVRARSMAVQNAAKNHERPTKRLRQGTATSGASESGHRFFDVLRPAMPQFGSQRGFASPTAPF